MISQSCSFDTERLTVKEWHAFIGRHGDLADAVATILTPRVTRYLPDGWQGEYTADRASRWIAERDQEGVTLLVLASTSMTPVGLMILFENAGDKAGRCIRIGFLLAEFAWGQGFAGELLKGFVDWCRSVDVSSIVGGVDRKNMASRHVLEKCGFTVLAGTQNQQELIYELKIE